MKAPAALTFVDPTTVLNQITVVPGSKVADFGCGAGYFTFEFAKEVGADGLVYALDVLPSALEAVVSRAKTQGVTNIVTKRVNLEQAGGSTLPPDSLDWVVLKDILFQNQKKDIILKEVTRVLKPDGCVLLMEWDPKSSMVGPDKNLRVSQEQMKQMVQAVGLVVSDEINVGGFHYAFVAKKEGVSAR